MARSVPDIPGILAPSHVSQHLQRRVAQLLGRGMNTAFPGSQPVSFSRRHLLENLLNEDYYVCEKSDGIRCLMYLCEEDHEERVYLITRKNEYYLVNDLHFPTERGPDTFHRDGLIDGELVISTSEDGKEELKFLMFDCLALNGKLLTSRNLDKRLGYLREYLFLPYLKLCEQFPEDTAMFPFKAKFKDMERSSALTKIFNEVLPRLKHVSDGLIFTSRWSPYKFGTDDKLLKWKPAEENTVDFMLVLEFPTFTDPDISPDDKTQSATYPIYDDKPTCHLYVWEGGSDHRPYSELHITDEEWEQLKALEEPLNDRIVEAFKDEENRWRYMRFRDDKEAGNYITTVDKVIESINDSVSKEELLEAWPEVRARWKEREQRGSSEDHHHHNNSNYHHHHHNNNNNQHVGMKRSNSITDTSMQQKRMKQDDV